MTTYKDRQVNAWYYDLRSILVDQLELLRELWEGILCCLVGLGCLGSPLLGHVGCLRQQVLGSLDDLGKLGGSSGAGEEQGQEQGSLHVRAGGQLLGSHWLGPVYRQRPAWRKRW